MVNKQTSALRFFQNERMIVMCYVDDVLLVVKDENDNIHFKNIRKKASIKCFFHAELFLSIEDPLKN